VRAKATSVEADLGSSTVKSSEYSQTAEDVFAQLEATAAHAVSQPPHEEVGERDAPTGGTYTREDVLGVEEADPEYDDVYGAYDEGVDVADGHDEHGYPYEYAYEEEEEHAQEEGAIGPEPEVYSEEGYDIQFVLLKLNHPNIKDLVARADTLSILVGVLCALAWCSFSDFLPRKPALIAVVVCCCVLGDLTDSDHRRGCV
jgi:hypothetical protein